MIPAYTSHSPVVGREADKDAILHQRVGAPTIQVDGIDHTMPDQ